MKTVLLVPGFQETLEDRDYQSVLKTINASGYTTKFVSITWQRTTVDDWARELEAEYAHHKPEDTILAGFSYGSIITLVVAAQRLPAELWLFSLSPYFSEDLPKLKKSWKNNIGHRRVTAFQALHFNQLAQHISCPTIIMLGAIEAKKWPITQRRSNIARRIIKNSRYVVIPRAAHDITDTKYLQAIKKTIGSVS